MEQKRQCRVALWHSYEQYVHSHNTNTKYQFDQKSVMCVGMYGGREGISRFYIRKVISKVK